MSISDHHPCGAHRCLRWSLIAAAVAVAALTGLVGCRRLLQANDLSGGSITMSVGRTMGLWATTLVLLQPIVASRMRILDRAFGLDVLLRFHRISAAVIVAMAVLHPMLVYGSGLRSAALDGHIWPQALGVAALAGLWLQVVSSFYRSFVALTWEQWRMLHKIAAPIAVLVIVHMFAVQGDLRSGWPLAICAGLLAVWAGITAHQMVVRWSHPHGHWAMQVTSVRQVGPKVTEITLSAGPEGEAAAFSPGQFIFVRFNSQAVTTQEHPFTIASKPDDNRALQLAIKASGDFTREVSGISPGDTATLVGPFGRFTPECFGRTRRLVMIAGGIGITPMLSVLRTCAHMAERAAATLVWSNRTSQDIIYRDELEQMQRDWDTLEVHHVLTREKGLSGEHSARLNVCALGKIIGGYEHGSHAMICGPGAMIHDTARMLRELGYPAAAIHFELFSL